MSQDGEHTGSANHDGTHPPSRDGVRSAAGRLPPPAFPPGARRGQVGHDVASSASALGDAFISPDDPMPPRSEVPDDAFISPDEPIVRKRAAAIVSIDPEEEVVTGVVTGMGDDAHLDPGELAAGGDPHVTDLVETVAKLAEALRRKGEAGLRTGPDMTRFEATLRAYCVGYLAGRRAEDEDA
jgi:hypothetical protein